MKTIKIKELGIEVETKIQQKGIYFKDIKIPKGWRLLKIDEIVFLFNNYKKKLNMETTWEFFEQPFKLNKEEGLVSRFYANPDDAVLSCGRNPLYSYSRLGVRFCKDLE